MFFGGMPGGGFPGVPQKREPADTTELYKTLGIEKSSTAAQIKKAYRKTAIKVHPDKNSAPKADEAFKAVGLAYATLSDPQKRTIYDRYGEEDPDNRGGGMGGRCHVGSRGGGCRA